MCHWNAAFGDFRGGWGLAVTASHTVNTGIHANKNPPSTKQVNGTIQKEPLRAAWHHGRVSELYRRGCINSNPAVAPESCRFKIPMARPKCAGSGECNGTSFVSITQCCTELRICHSVTSGKDILKGLAIWWRACARCVVSIELLLWTRSPFARVHMA